MYFIKGLNRTGDAQVITVTLHTPRLTRSLAYLHMPASSAFSSPPPSPPPAPAAVPDPATAQTLGPTQTPSIMIFQVPNNQLTKKLKMFHSPFGITCQKQGEDLL